MRRTSFALLGLPAALLFGHLASPCTANDFYVTIEGIKQGRFQGESNRERFRGQIPGLSFSYEVRSPRDKATGQAQGKPQHGAITFTKEWGAATPQIFQALVTDELLKSVVFEFVRTSPKGEQETHQFIRLGNAMVSHVKWRKPEPTTTEAGEKAATKEIEEVSLIFQRIEVENVLGKTQASDDVAP